MFGKKEKVIEVYNPYKGMAKYCKFDGNELVEGTREVTREWFGEVTGIKLVEARYQKYCPDWQKNRQVHTEVYKRNTEYDDGSPFRDNFWEQI